MRKPLPSSSSSSSCAAHRLPGTPGRSASYSSSSATNRQDSVFSRRRCPIPRQNIENFPFRPISNRCAISLFALLPCSRPFQPFQNQLFAHFLSVYLTGEVTNKFEETVRVGGTSSNIPRNDLGEDQWASVVLSSRVSLSLLHNFSPFWPHF